MKKQITGYSILFLLLGSGALTQFMMAIAALAMARLYDPELFGELGLYAGLGSLVAVFSGLRYDHIAFSQTAHRKHSLFFVSFLVCFIVPIFATLVFSILALYLFKDKYSINWAIIFCYSYSIFYLATQYLIAIGRYRTFSLLRFVQVVILIAIGVGSTELVGDIGLLLAYSVSQFVIGAFVVVFYFTNFTKNNIRHATLLAGRFYRIARINSLVVVLQYSTSFAPILMGYVLYDKSEMGAYYLFAQIFSAPLAIFRRSFLNFLNVEFPSPKHALMLLENKEKLTKILSILIVVSICLLIGIGEFSQEITVIVFGVEWGKYSYLLLPLFVFFLLDAFLQPFTTLLTLWACGGKAFGYEIVRFLVVFIALPVIVKFQDISFFYFFIMYSFVMIAIYVCILLSVIYSVILVGRNSL